MTELLIREAREDDVASIVALFAADTLGAHGDTTAPDALPDYISAFRRIAASPNDTLYVAQLGGAVVGTFQTTMITSMIGRGGKSLKVEAVHTSSVMRGKGIGAAMMRFAIEQARDAGARSVQLTSNNARADAHRFYERLGFVKSHAGFKMVLR
jgi:GNAT superfamily N-acetyltransferase